MQQIAHVMGNSFVTPEEVGKAGAHLFLTPFGGNNDGDSLNSLCYVKLLQMVSASNY